MLFLWEMSMLPQNTVGRRRSKLRIAWASFKHQDWVRMQHPSYTQSLCLNLVRHPSYELKKMMWLCGPNALSHKKSPRHCDGHSHLTFGQIKKIIVLWHSLPLIGKRSPDRDTLSRPLSPSSSAMVEKITEMWSLIPRVLFDFVLMENKCQHRQQGHVKQHKL